VNTELTIWTIGHSTRPLDEFLRCLADNGIQLLADVRSHPGSRRHPQYGQSALRDSLIEAGVDYCWMPALGGRRRARADSPNTAWRNASFRGYADYMQTPEFAAGFAGMLQGAREQRTALMCAEAVWWQCHRSLIADALKAAGARVLHIMTDREAVEHPYTKPARIVNGKLTYTEELQMNLDMETP
jgi:uncharacterized protein (DUF488 family)